MKQDSNARFLVKNAPIPAIFPKAGLKSACFVSLDDLAQKLDRAGQTSRFLKSDLTNRYLRLLHRAANCDVSYGGYLEDRATLWRGSYLQDHNAVHLGIDINLPAGTAVSVLHPCSVVNIAHDVDQAGGWGSVLMFKLDAPIGAISHFLYAHLSAASITVHIGDHLGAGQIVAALGKAHENGGWYEHLHVQALTQEAWDKTGGILANFDGYDVAQDGDTHPFFPNPMPLIG